MPIVVPGPPCADAVAQFVDGIADDAAIRLDINDGENFIVREGWQFPTPAMRREIVANATSDGGIIPFSAYDMRELRIPLLVLGGDTHMETANQNVMAANFKSLHRELNRERNILRWRVPGVTNYLYFVTHRDPSHDYTQKLYLPMADITLELLADPFGYRPMVTLDSVTIDNDPASTSRPQFWDVSGIDGEVQVPAMIRLETAADDPDWIISTRERGDPTVLNQMVLQAEDQATSGPDTTVETIGGFSNGQGTRTTFSIATLETRLYAGDTIPGAASPSADFRGLYRVYIYIQASDLLNEFEFEFKTDEPFPPVPVRVAPASTDRLRVDLGVYGFPTVEDPVTVGPDIAQLQDEAHAWTLKVARTAGSGSLDIDYIRLVPADESLAQISGTDVSNGVVSVDGYNEAVYVGDFQTQLIDRLGHLDWLGGLPMLTPNQVNRIYLLQSQIGILTDRLDDITESTDVVIGYYPAFLSVPS